VGRVRRGEDGRAGVPARQPAARLLVDLGRARVGRQVTILPAGYYSHDLSLPVASNCPFGSSTSDAQRSRSPVSRWIVVTSTTVSVSRIRLNAASSGLMMRKIWSQM